MDDCMPWCDGRRHGPSEEFDWDCVFVVEWTDSAGEPARAWVQGARCDHVHVDLEGGLYDPSDLDALVSALTTLRPYLEVGRQLAECDGCRTCDPSDGEVEDTDDGDGDGCCGGPLSTCSYVECPRVGNVEQYLASLTDQSVTAA